MSPLRGEKHQNHPSSPSMTEQPLHLLLAVLAVTTMRPVNCHRIVVYLRAAISEKWRVMVCRTVILVVVFSQFLRGLQVNFCVRIDGRWEERGFPFFGVFAVRHVTSSAAVCSRCKHSPAHCRMPTLPCVYFDTAKPLRF